MTDGSSHALSPLQQHLIDQSRYEGDDWVIGQVALKLRHAVDVDRLGEAWETVASAHPLTPMCLVRDENDEPELVLDPDLGAPPIEQLDSVTPGQRLPDPFALALALIDAQGTCPILTATFSRIVWDYGSVYALLSQILGQYGAVPRLAWSDEHVHDAAPAQREGASPELGKPMAFDRLRPPTGGHRGFGVVHTTCEADTTAGVHDLARRLGHACAVVVLAAWSLVVSRYSGRHDVVVGLEISGRPDGGTAWTAPGVYEVIVPVRVRTQPGESCEALMSSVAAGRDLVRSERLTGGRHHQTFSGPRPENTSLIVREELSPTVQLSDGPVADVIERRPLPSVPVEAHIVLGRQLRLEIVHSEQVMASAMASRMLGHLIQVLRAFVTDPARQLADVALVTPAERELHATRGRGPSAQYESRVVAMIERQAATNPVAVAVTDAVSSLSYSELNARANQLAQHLRRCGIQPNDLVGVCLERSVELIVVLLAVHKAGAAYVPIATDGPAQRMAYILEDAEIAHVVAGRDQQSTIAALPGSVRLVVPDGEDREAIAACPTVNLPTAVRGDDVAYLLYTSGSTGAPKGVLVTHDGLANYVSWAAATYCDGGRSLSLMHTPVTFDLTVTSLWVPLAAGGTVQVVAEAEALELSTVAVSNRSLLLKATPAHIAQLVATADAVFTGEVTMVFGGEQLSWSQLRLVRTMTPRARFFNEYGPTETVVGSCFYSVPDAIQTADGPVPIGVPIANTRCCVLNEYMHPAPVGVTGELYIGGSGVARGYLNRSAQTSERFLHDGSAGSSDGRMYRTGDLVRALEDGNLEFVGRTDGQIKLRGYRIEPGEIEATLLRRAGVREAIVVAREDRPGVRRIVAYVASGDPQLGAEELRRHLEQWLPAYMIPAAFAVLPDLPMTSSGKIDRDSLPDPDRVVAREDIGRPLTRTESELREIWAAALGIEEIAPGDDFFELGGDSILAIHVASRVKKRFGVNLSVRTLFELGTLARFAEFVDEQGQAA